MLKPGEKVVAAVNHRDIIIIFGSYGSVLRMWFDPITAQMHVERHMDLEYLS